MVLHLASFGTQKTFSAMYSSRLSSSISASVPVMPSDSSSVASSALRASKASETYLRKINPRTTCLYSAASIEPRSLSAACHSASGSTPISLALTMEATSASWLLGGTSLHSYRGRSCHHVGYCSVIHPADHG